MASPSPVPPYYRVVVTSAWVNGSKTLETCSTVMPTPVSVTTNSMWRAPSTSHRCTCSVIAPLRVNLAALLSRFSRSAAS